MPTAVARRRFLTPTSSGAHLDPIKSATVSACSHPIIPMLCSSLAVLLAALCASAVPSVKIGSTTVVGRDNSFASFQQEFFGGIPYAEPPTGHLRLIPPVLKTRIDVETFIASDYGPACLQTGVPLDQISEDCLTINILRPSGIPQSAYPLPVMFWTYGGGFFGGNSSVYNATLIVGQSVARGTPIIYVNFNYRLGPLGFAQGTDAAHHGALNLGLKDQVAALQWVQANIGAFGGDKNKVTLFGESAGSIMTSLLFLSPSLLKRLARAAIFESGWSATLGIYPPSRNQLDWDHFAAAIPQCASFACIKSNASTSDLLTAMATTVSSSVEEFPWMPVLDGELIKDLPSRIFARGQFAKLPFIAGTNLDEGTSFTPPTIGSADEMRAILLQSVLRTSSNTSAVPPVELQNAVEELLELYPDDPALGSPFNTGNQTFGLSSTFKRASAILTDLQFVALRRQFMDAASSAAVSAYGYLFTQPQPELPPAIGVTHAVELTYVYGLPSDQSASSIALSSIMVDYWVSFATSLTPNDGLGNPRPEWCAYTSKNKAVIQLNEANLTMIPDDFRSAQTAFIN
ncbi:extracellular triacylglycerol lipase precursor, partial [Mycena amicta]